MDQSSDASASGCSNRSGLCKISRCSNGLIAYRVVSGEAFAVRNKSRYCVCSVDMGIAYEGVETRSVQGKRQSWRHGTGSIGRRLFAQCMLFIQMGSALQKLELSLDSTVPDLYNEVLQIIGGESSKLKLLHEERNLQKAMKFEEVGFSLGEGQLNQVTAVVLRYPFPDHEWDFRNCVGEVEDTYSNLVARNYGAIPSAEGMVFDGIGQYVKQKERAKSIPLEVGRPMGDSV